MQLMFCELQKSLPDSVSGLVQARNVGALMRTAGLLH